MHNILQLYANYMHHNGSGFSYTANILKELNMIPFE